MNLKIVKHGKRYFFAKSGKEWDIEKFFDEVTDQGLQLIEVKVTDLEIPAVMELKDDMTLDMWLTFLAQWKQLKAGKMKVVVL